MNKISQTAEHRNDFSIHFPLPFYVRVMSQVEKSNKNSDDACVVRRWRMSRRAQHGSTNKLSHA